MWEGPWGEEAPWAPLAIRATPSHGNTHTAEVSAWPGNSEDLSSWRRWAFALPYHARTPAEGCTQRILGELESIPASKELDSRPTLPLRFRQLVLPVDRVSELLR